MNPVADSTEHTLSLRRGGKLAGHGIPEPITSSPRDPVVEAIAQGLWDYSPSSEQPPGISQVAGQPEHRLGADQHPFVLTVPLNPRHRINAGQLGVPQSHPSSKVALEGREPERAIPVSAQDQPHDPVAETAVTIEEQNRLSRVHGRSSSTRWQANLAVIFALAPRRSGDNIQRVMPLLRPLVSALVAACFALSTVTWGSMPGCATPGHAVESHVSGHHDSHTHSGAGGEVPDAPKCFVHLCCIQLATLSPAAEAVERFTTPDRAPGFLAKPRVAQDRPSHTLPFAHAPPRFIA